MTASRLAESDRIAAELDELLSEQVSDCERREMEAFERAAGDGAHRVVLFGAGGLGRRTLAGLRASGLEPLAFSDNRADLWGTSIDGLEVLEPNEAANKLGATAVFVVTIWGAGSPHRYEHSVTQLSRLGCQRVQPATWI